MFQSNDEARTKFAATGATAAQVGAILGVLRPAIGFAPLAVAGEAPIGGTRIGGTPDLTPDLDWPIRPAAPNVEEIAKRGGPNHADHIRKHRGRDLPFEFFAQIDLAEAAALGDVAADLPGEGRLLFFYDSMSGPWDTGQATCRVIWDRAPRETLTRRPIPDVFVTLGEEYVKEAYEATVEAFKQHDLPPPKREEFKSPYWGPARALRLASLLMVPDISTVEADIDPDLKALYGDDAVSDALTEASGEAREHALLLGVPVSEQDDPRYDMTNVPGPTDGETSEERAARVDEMNRQGAEWRLLLQVPISDYMQERSEGTVYFVIRSIDLAARRFGEVAAVYQQT